jgi:hypothetical protein
MYQKKSQLFERPAGSDIAQSTKKSDIENEKI